MRKSICLGLWQDFFCPVAAGFLPEVGEPCDLLPETCHQILSQAGQHSSPINSLENIFR